MTNLTFNIFTFEHPQSEYTFYFTDKEHVDLCRVFHTLVPDEVIKHFGEQEHYYTSFNNPLAESVKVVKDAIPTYETVIDEEGVEYSKRVQESCFSTSVLKRYYNLQIQQYFKHQGLLVKPNFISDIEIWIQQSTVDHKYTFYENIQKKRS